MDTFGKVGHESVALVILEHLCAVFGDHPQDVDIENLARLKTTMHISARGQFFAVDLDHCNLIRIIDFLKRCADAALLPAGFSARCGFGRLFSVRIARWRLAAVSTAVQIETIYQQADGTLIAIRPQYKDRWQIELFFKALKQNQKFKTFVGTSENILYIQI